MMIEDETGIVMKMNKSSTCDNFSLKFANNCRYHTNLINDKFLELRLFVVKPETIDREIRSFTKSIRIRFYFTYVMTPLSLTLKPIAATVCTEDNTLFHRLRDSIR